MDARDYFRGLRPWDQFFNYVKTLALTEGTQFWAAQLEDERFDKEIQQKIAEMKKTDMRPSLIGYSRLVAMLDELTDHVHMLRAESGRWERAPRPRPKPRMPSDRAEEREIALGRAMIAALVDQAHALIPGRG